MQAQAQLIPQFSPEQMGEALVNVMADRGFAFVENDKLPAFITWLQAFLETAGLPINPPNTDLDVSEAAG